MEEHRGPKGDMRIVVDLFRILWKLDLSSSRYNLYTIMIYLKHFRGNR